MELNILIINSASFTPFPSLIGRLGTKKKDLWLPEGIAGFPSLIGRLGTSPLDAYGSSLNNFPSLIGRLGTQGEAHSPL